MFTYDITEYDRINVKRYMSKCLYAMVPMFWSFYLSCSYTISDYLCVNITRLKAVVFTKGNYS